LHVAEGIVVVQSTLKDGTSTSPNVPLKPWCGILNVIGGWLRPLTNASVVAVVGVQALELLAEI
jgi:hypothetical protein